MIMDRKEKVNVFRLINGSYKGELDILNLTKKGEKFYLKGGYEPAPDKYFLSAEQKSEIKKEKQKKNGEKIDYLRKLYWIRFTVPLAIATAILTILTFVFDIDLLLYLKQFFQWIF